MEFHWWYGLILLAILVFMFGRGKGGVVATRVTASMQVIDPRFADCRIEADYCTFRNKGPDHIEIELENLPLEPGEKLEILINDAVLAQATVNGRRKAQFDHWSDEGVEFPVVEAGDALRIRHRGADVATGTFR